MGVCVSTPSSTEGDGVRVDRPGANPEHAALPEDDEEAHTSGEQQQQQRRVDAGAAPAPGRAASTGRAAQLQAGANNEDVHVFIPPRATLIGGLQCSDPGAAPTSTGSLNSAPGAPFTRQSTLQPPHSQLAAAAAAAPLMPWGSNLTEVMSRASSGASPALPEAIVAATRHVAVSELGQEVHDLAFIGQGASGDVYKGRWNGATVAIKYIFSETTDAQEAATNEAVLGRLLAHPNVVQTFSCKTTLIDEGLTRQMHATLWGHLPAQPTSRQQQQALGLWVGTEPPATEGGGAEQAAEGAWREGLRLPAGAVEALAAAAGLPAGRGGAALLPLLASQQQQAPVLVDSASASMPAAQLLQPQSSGAAASALAAGGDSAGGVAVGAPGQQAAEEEGATGHDYHSGEGFGPPVFSHTQQSLLVIQEVLLRANASGRGAVAGQLTQIIMEHCDKGSLAQAIGKKLFLPSSKWGARLALRALLRTAQEVAQGMWHIHQCNVIHGDLKPGNVLLKSSRADRRGFIAKVSDFGLSRISDRTTHDSKHWGTVCFMAPEAFDGALAPQSDVYSFGITLWQMVTGEQPWADLHPGQIIVGVQAGELQLDWPPHAHPRLVKLGRDCLQHDRKSRPNFHYVIKELGQIESLVRLEGAAALASAAQLQQPPGLAPPSSIPSSSRPSPSFPSTSTHPHPHPHPYSPSPLSSSSHLQHQPASFPSTSTVLAAAAAHAPPRPTSAPFVPAALLSVSSASTSTQPPAGPAASVPLATPATPAAAATAQPAPVLLLQRQAQRHQQRLYAGQGRGGGDAPPSAAGPASESAAAPPPLAAVPQQALLTGRLHSGAGDEPTAATQQQQQQQQSQGSVTTTAAGSSMREPWSMPSLQQPRWSPNPSASPERTAGDAAAEPGIPPAAGVAGSSAGEPLRASEQQEQQQQQPAAPQASPSLTTLVKALSAGERSESPSSHAASPHQALAADGAAQRSSTGEQPQQCTCHHSRATPPPSCGGGPSSFAAAYAGPEPPPSPPSPPATSPAPPPASPLPIFRSASSTSHAPEPSPGLAALLAGVQAPPPLPWAVRGPGSDQSTGRSASTGDAWGGSGGAREQRGSARGHHAESGGASGASGSAEHSHGSGGGPAAGRESVAAASGGRGGSSDGSGRRAGGGVTAAEAVAAMAARGLGGDAAVRAALLVRLVSGGGGGGTRGGSPRPSQA